MNDDMQVAADRIAGGLLEEYSTRDVNREPDVALTARPNAARARFAESVRASDMGSSTMYDILAGMDY